MDVGASNSSQGNSINPIPLSNLNNPKIAKLLIKERVDDLKVVISSEYSKVEFIAEPD